MLLVTLLNSMAVVQMFLLGVFSLRRVWPFRRWRISSTATVSWVLLVAHCCCSWKFQLHWQTFQCLAVALWFISFSSVNNNFTPGLLLPPWKVSHLHLPCSYIFIWSLTFSRAQCCQYYNTLRYLLENSFQVHLLDFFFNNDSLSVQTVPSIKN